ncbi:MAG: phosphoribosylamine--glycine ligase [Euryarchaeota archaeon]|nr:phosphoribosylamine--glycine ligase [Euryarchaeota archaeon]
MKVLLVGGGAREHAIAEAIKRSGAELFAAMKNRNPGIARLSEKILLEHETETKKIAEFAKESGVDFAVIGPEAPLAEGIVDVLGGEGIPCVGPAKKLARIEASKEFMRNLMQKYKIPGSLEYAVFDDAGEASEFIDSYGKPIAVKPVGLTGGKGVKVIGDQLKDLEEAKKYVREVIEKKIGGDRVVIEEKAVGEEFTIQAFVDGSHVIAMPMVQDHKRAFEGDAGHNTGGMGSYSDSNGLLPFVTESDREYAVEVMKKTVDALRRETREEYKGILYGQFMLGKEPRLIEFNCRFGDPEAMNVLPILSSDFVKICQKIIDGTLKERDAVFEKKATVCKYVVPEGYGIGSRAGEIISVDEEAIRRKRALLYYAAVNEENGKICTTSSRSLAVVGTAGSIEEAEKIAESAIANITGEHIYHRRDIGTKALIQRKIESMKAVR